MIEHNNPEPLPVDLIPASEAAKLAKSKHVVDVHRWVRRGLLPGWRRAGRWFVSKADVLGLFEQVKPE